LNKVIVVILLISVVLVSGCTNTTNTQKEYVCPDGSTVYSPSSCPTTIKQEATMDLSKIDVSSENLNYDLWINARGGSASQMKYITVKNNNDIAIGISINCKDEAYLKSSYVGCNAQSGSVEPHASTTFWVQVYSQLSPQTYLGEYSTTAKVEVGDSGEAYKSLSEFPIHIKVNCLSGCCKSGEYVYSDCV